MKPDWKTAPWWANWLCMDKNGDWSWYYEKPIIFKSMWIDRETNGLCGNWAYAKEKGDGVGWRQSLEENPMGIKTMTELREIEYSKLKALH